MFFTLFAEIDEPDRQFASDLVAHRGRDANPAGLGNRLQPGGDVDRVAEQVCSLDDHVADMDADAEPHGFALGHARIFRGQSLLHRDGALHGIDGTGEIGDDAVAGGVEDPPAICRDQPVHDFAARFERSSVPASSAPISRL